MLTYNTHLKSLVLPEYGRNIQRMVDHCLTVEDREARNACAATIVRTMETLFPPVGDIEEYRRKLWDHLAIMSDFALDIDWPYEVIRPDSLQEQPQPIPLSQTEIRHRQYGKNLEAMIACASEMPEGPERDELMVLLANQMKKMLVNIDNDIVDDEKVYKDLLQMSHGVLRMSADKAKLYEYKAVPQSKKKKKK